MEKLDGNKWMEEELRKKKKGNNWVSALERIITALVY